MPEPTLIRECAHRDSAGPVHIHFHNAYELLFIKNGRIRITIDGMVYDGGPGSIFVIGRFEEHTLTILSKVYDRWFLIIDPDRIGHLITDRRLLSALRNRPKDFSHRFDLAADLSRVEILFTRLLEECQSPGAFSELMQMSLLHELLILLYRADSGKMCEEQPIPPSVLAVQAYIEGHYAEPLSISDLAARVFMSSCHLSHLFKAATGYSPKQYLVLNRLAGAKQLLASTDLPVAEVAQRSGYPDVNNFIRTFRKETGLTPLVYRKQQQG